LYGQGVSTTPPVGKELLKNIKKATNCHLHAIKEKKIYSQFLNINIERHLPPDSMRREISSETYRG